MRARARVDLQYNEILISLMQATVLFPRGRGVEARMWIALVQVAVELGNKISAVAISLFFRSFLLSRSFVPSVRLFLFRSFSCSFHSHPRLRLGQVTRASTRCADRHSSAPGSPPSGDRLPKKRLSASAHRRAAGGTQRPLHQRRSQVERDMEQEGRDEEDGK